MPIQEPGVIVNITGQTLPPPNPPTRFGVANYVFSKDGPFKTRAILNSRYPYPFEGIVPGACLNDVAFVKDIAPIYAQILPNFGHKPPIAIMSVSDTVHNQIKDANNPKKVSADYEKLFILPLWLNGPPRFMAKYSISSINLSLPSQEIDLRSDTNRSGYIEINGDTLYSIPNLTSPASSNFPTSIAPNDFALYNCVIYGSIPSNSSSPMSDFSLHVYIRSSASRILNLDGNLYMVFDFKYDSNSSSWNLDLYVYSDTTSWALSSNPAQPNMSITLGWIDNSTGAQNAILSSASLNNNHVIHLSKADPTSDYYFDIVYFTTYGSNNSLSITDTPSSDNPYELTFTRGSTNIRVPLSYSPLHTGYYGFIDLEDLEIVENGSIYDSITSNSQNVDMYVSSYAHKLNTDIKFYDPRHDLRIHKTYLDNSFFDSSYTGGTQQWPDEYGGTYSNNPLDTSNNLDDNYVYVNKYVTPKNISDVYMLWMRAWNEYVIYRDADVRPILEAPLQADILTDFGGNISYGFTQFIRDHNKFMFKVLGTPDLTNVRLRDVYNYVRYYWSKFDLKGFHYLRLQGNSATGVSASALYCKAAFDYRFNPIFGINATLSVSEVDYEFVRSHREDLLEQNVNTIVMDRNLFLWYFNNNLTEEPRRDDSPLGEECNARVAIRLTKLLGAYVDRYIGQPNNAVTRSRITNDLTNYIRTFITNNPSNLVDFKVICDESNNTPNDIANNILNIRVEARFGKSIKYIVIFERVLASL